MWIISHSFKVDHEPSIFNIYPLVRKMSSSILGEIWYVQKLVIPTWPNFVQTDLVNRAAKCNSDNINQTFIL